MSYSIRKEHFFSCLSNPKFLLFLWVTICAVASFKQYTISNVAQGTCCYNNFRIFCQSFEHLIQHKNLYHAYPAEYFDLYHYGPVFALLIAPFYYLPVGLSLVLWGALNAWCLFKAIWALPLDSNSKAIIIWISTNTLVTSTLNTQFHAICTSMIILSYAFIIGRKEIWSTLLIVLGAFIKLYGVVGFVFFFFSKNKKKFILWTFLWSLIVFLLPMLVSKPSYVLQSYADWYTDLRDKNGTNVDITQMRLDVCVMGMFRKIFHNATLSNLYYIIPAFGIMGISFFRLKFHKQINFQLGLLASLLMFIILASTGSESPTYIMAFPGVGIWYVLERKKNLPINLLLILTLAVSSFSPTDLFPRFVRINYLEPYAMMALPVFLVWLRLNYIMIMDQLKYIDYPISDSSSNIS